MTENKFNSMFGTKGQDADYYKFEEVVRTRFENLVHSGAALFRTNSDHLYSTYLSALPSEIAQEYNCRTCKHFFERYGDLVMISDTGEITSVLWDFNEVPGMFKRPVMSIQHHVENSQISGVFLSEERYLGNPKTGEWSHLSVELPSSLRYSNRLQTSGQAMAEKREDYLMLNRATENYPIEIVDQALALIQTETMYRSDKVLGITTWFKKLLVQIETATSRRQRSNMIWLTAATAPAGFAHIRSSMVGTLFEDIKNGLSASSVASRFAEKMNPSNYMRSQAAPTQNAIQQAEEQVAMLGLEYSLQRRYAQLEELPFLLWETKTTFASAPAKPLGLFANVKAKDKPTIPVMDLPHTVMTWDKFSRTVLPAVTEMDVLVEDENRFMALVTAADETAPGILQWDNHFSWYYHGGVDAEIKRRVESAGGRYEDNEIRVSLIWEGYTDLDLHARTPGGGVIDFRNKRDRRSTGFLDIDANGGSPDTLTPVENIRWELGAPSGNYEFIVHNFQERGNGQTPFTVELEVNGKVTTYKGVAGSTGFRETVFEFGYAKGQDIVHLSNKRYETGQGTWGVAKGTFKKVTAITTSPNLWSDTPTPQAGHHMFFLLDELTDATEGKGRGFFNEMLLSELRPMRKTLELYAAGTPIQGAEQATACGVGYSKDLPWDLNLKVKTDTGSRFIKIDRWD